MNNKNYHLDEETLRRIERMQAIYVVAVTGQWICIVLFVVIALAASMQPPAIARWLAIVSGLCILIVEMCLHEICDNAKIMNGTFLMSAEGRYIVRAVRKDRKASSAE